MSDWQDNEDAGDLSAMHAADASEFIGDDATDLCEICECEIDEGEELCIGCETDVMADVNYREDFHADM